MTMQKTVLILAMVGFSSVASAEGAPPPKSAVSPYVDKLFAAVRQCDKDALYALTEQAQDELAQINASKPEFLREKKQKEHRETWQAAFDKPNSGAPAEYVALAPLLDLDPSVEIMEVDSNGPDALSIYIHLRFKTIEKSPLLVSPARLVKERTLRFSMTKGGRYLSYTSVPEVPDVNWTNLPTQIVAAQVFGPPAYFRIVCMTVGDSPLKGAVVAIGGHTLDANCISISEETRAIEVKFDTIYTAVPMVQTEDTPVSITINDAQGQTSKASFVMPPFVKGDNESLFRQDMYVREPWRGMKMWKTLPKIKLLQ